MKVKYSYLAEQFTDFESYVPALRRLVKSGEFTLGPYVERFEKQFGHYIGVKHVISTNTGTDALILALKAAGVKPGDEVITVCNTFVATVGAIVAAGARPVFVDCDERYQIDAEKIGKAVTRRTRVILPVHWGGSSPDMKRIMAIADRKQITVVEDACPAVGAKVDGRFAGSFGLVNAFSMHPLKPLNVWGDGGMIATDNDKIAAFLRLYRNHGLSDRNHIDLWGVNSRLQPVQAVVAMRVLADIERSIKSRNRNARLLDEGLSGLGKYLRTPKRFKGHREVYQLYLASASRRDELVKHLIKHGVEVKIHYPIPLHLQKAAKSLGYKRGDFPVCEKQAAEVLTIPSHQHVSAAQIRYTVDCIHDFYRRVS